MMGTRLGDYGNTMSPASWVMSPTPRRPSRWWAGFGGLVNYEPAGIEHHRIR